MERLLHFGRKATVAALGALATAVAMGVLPEPWNTVAAAVLAVGTYFGVYQTENVRRELP